VTDCMAIVSYGFDEAAANFNNDNVTLHTLTTFDHILKYAHNQGKINETVLQSVQTWMQRPYTWEDKNKPS